MAATATAIAERPTRRDVRRLREVLAVAGAALLFGVLAAVVRLGWAPLQSADSALDRNLNALVAPHPAVVRLLTAVTTMGSAGVLLWLVVLAEIVLLTRRRYRIAAYLAVTAIGAPVLDPALKALIGRLRPVVPNPIAFGGGNSFPSGHALDSLICYGALVLVFLPAVPPRGRRALLGAVGTLVALIGVSRVLLGVHFVTDVIGAWCAGIAWLGLTVYAFELSRTRAGQRVAQPLAEGVEPEAAPDVQPVEPASEPVRERSAELRVAAWLVIGWVLVLGAVAGLGQLIAYAGDNLLGDRSIPHWFAAHRTAALNPLGDVGSEAGNTHVILAVGLVGGAIALGQLRRWRPVVFLLVLMMGELGLFLASAGIVGRARPDVPQLDGALPTSAYPSGHVAATICLYTGLALLVLPRTRAWWRWLTVAAAIIMPVLVAASRLYRGMHHPTDILASVLLAGAWTATVYLVLQPNRDIALPATEPERERERERERKACQ
ncbi:MAG: phosphatase PAP2 family protein [Micromonosporaceae bacterium]